MTMAEQLAKEGMKAAYPAGAEEWQTTGLGWTPATDRRSVKLPRTGRPPKAASSTAIASTPVASLQQDAPEQDDAVTSPLRTSGRKRGRPPRYTEC